MPNKLEKANHKNTKEMLAFYWVDGQELVTCKNQHDPHFLSDDETLIWIWGAIRIYNHRRQMDYAELDYKWAFRYQGNDGYPNKS